MILKKIEKTLLRPISRALKGKPDKFLKNVTGIIHVGANTGQERELYRYYGVNVIWIEPIPSVFDQLNDNIKDFENQYAIQSLITDVDDQEYEFHIASNNGGSSSILEFAQHKDVWPHVYYTTTMHIKSLTLATLFEKERIDASQYQALIMDTQGSELLVLRGAIPVLSHVRYIKTEAWDFESYKGCCQVSDINDFMVGHGFKEISRKKHAGKEKGGFYFDIVYRRET